MVVAAPVGGPLGCKATANPDGLPDGGGGTDGGAGRGVVDTPPERKTEDGPSAQAPAVTSVTPAFVVVRTPPPVITVTGKDFVRRSFVELDFVPLVTFFVSETELRAQVPAEAMDAVGARRLTVTTTPPGGGTSAFTGFTVGNATPTITGMTPNAVVANAGETTVMIEGSGFGATTKVRFGTSELPAFLMSSTSVRLTVPASALTAAGSVPVVVVNDAPGGGASTPLSFTVANPTVTITSLAPSSAVVGGAATSVTVNGTGFVGASSATFNGTSVTTRFVDATTLSVDVPVTALATIGNFPIVVTNPAPGGGVSLPKTFVVGNPAPVVTGFTPGGLDVGSDATPVLVRGTGFVAASTAFVDGLPAATVFRDAQNLDVTLPASALARVRGLPVRVVNPAPGGGSSAAATFDVRSTRPVLTDVSPDTLEATGDPAKVTLRGSGFVRESTVLLDDSTATFEFVSDTQLRVDVPSFVTQGPGSVSVRVANPGGLVSDTSTLTIRAAGGTSCDGTGVDAVLDVVGASQRVSLDYGYGPARRFYYSPSESAYHTCPVSDLSSTQTPFAGTVVQNATNEFVYLEASANCGASDDAYLAIYETTSTIPTSDAARKACTGYVSNGRLGGGSRESPNSGGSSACPGLTKANGGGVLLFPCEKAVVVTQPFRADGTGRPTSIDVRVVE